MMLEYLPKNEQLQAQLVCRCWHIKHVPLAMPITYTKLSLILAKVSMMLRAPPKGSNPAAITNWYKNKPLTIEQLERYWAWAVGDTPLFDLENAEFDEWIDGHYSWLGMRHKLTG